MSVSWWGPVSSQQLAVSSQKSEMSNKQETLTCHKSIIINCHQSYQSSSIVINCHQSSSIVINHHQLSSIVMTINKHLLQVCYQSIITYRNFYLRYLLVFYINSGIVSSWFSCLLVWKPAWPLTLLATAILLLVVLAGNSNFNPLPHLNLYFYHNIPAFRYFSAIHLVIKGIMNICIDSYVL